MSPHRLAFFSAAIVTALTAILTVVMPAGIASAASVTAAGNRVWAISSAAHDHARADRLVSAGEHRGEPGSCPFCAPGACVAPEDVPLASGRLYINGSKSANNLTPRLTETDGLSSYDSIEAGIKPGGKGQCFDVACLSEGGLGAFKTGPPGHYSIRPLQPGGLDEWLGSRANGTFEESPFTQFLQSIAETVWNR